MVIMDIEMPENCTDCPFSANGFGGQRCLNLAAKSFRAFIPKDGRHKDCPFISDDSLREISAIWQNKINIKT